MFNLLFTGRAWKLSCSLCAQVGKISKYDLESNIVILVQVPGYPVVPEKIDDEASAALPETSPYGEDGSLEVY